MCLFIYLESEMEMSVFIYKLLLYGDFVFFEVFHNVFHLTHCGLLLFDKVIKSSYSFRGGNFIRCTFVLPLL